MSELECSLIDLVRVGASGNADGVRQLANRLARRVPAGVSNNDEFRSAVGDALASGIALRTKRPSTLRRATTDALPRDGDSSLPLAELDVSPSVATPVLSHDAQAQLDAVLRERERREELWRAGLDPSKTVLLSGPPGVGKTMTATYIATRLGLPLLTIDLASVMSSYLGKTGQNLRSALDYGRGHDAVVLLDEFDALAKRRDDDTDIGELKRLVNVLLLELERWPSSSLLVAATNHRQLLDAAIERRFDVVIELGLPEADGRAAILRANWPLGEVDDEQLQVLVAATEGVSGSDLVSAARAAAKRSLLGGDAPFACLVAEILSRQTVARGGRDQLIRAMHEHLGASNREIAALVGVTHPTVAAAIRRTDRRSQGG